jgi:hypothetical protein
MKLALILGSMVVAAAAFVFFVWKPFRNARQSGVEA